MAEGTTGSKIGSIYRYPVKGLSAERLDRVALTVGECLPHDRRFAIALPSTSFDPARPEPRPPRAGHHQAGNSPGMLLLR